MHAFKCMPCILPIQPSKSCTLFLTSLSLVKGKGGNKTTIFLLPDSSDLHGATHHNIRALYFLTPTRVPLGHRIRLSKECHAFCLSLKLAPPPPPIPPSAKHSDVAGRSSASISKLGNRDGPNSNDIKWVFLCLFFFHVSFWFFLMIQFQHLVSLFFTL
jgi:hypothetical protein